MATYDYDVIVIGGGSGGLTAAPLAAELGARTALVEQSKLGGECLWSGCVPSKALLKVSKVAHTVQMAHIFGVDGVTSASVDMPRAIASVQRAMRGVEASDSVESLTELGIDVVFGTARFVDAHTLAVAGRQLRARRFVIATGSAPLIPALPGLREAPQTITNEQLFDMREKPEHVVVIGGGYIGVEMAQALARLGAHVSLVEYEDCLLREEDQELAVMLTDLLCADGIDILLGARVERVTSSEQMAEVHVRHQGRALKLPAHRILVATGRAARSATLNLDAAGVRCGEKGVVLVNRYLQTNQPHIYAVGDVNGRYPFSHMAAYEASIAVPNALLPFKKAATYPVVAWSLFTDPELAHLGLTEQQARVRYKRAVVIRHPFTETDRAHAEHATTGMLKIIASPIRGKILGVHILGAAAGEAIHSWIVAMQHGLTVRDMVTTTHIYPTIATGNQEAAVAFYRNSPFWYGAQRIARRIMPTLMRLS